LISIVPLFYLLMYELSNRRGIGLTRLCAVHSSPPLDSQSAPVGGLTRLCAVHSSPPLDSQSAPAGGLTRLSALHRSSAAAIAHQMAFPSCPCHSQNACKHAFAVTTVTSELCTEKNTIILEKILQVP
jgi:hypothetical protein